MRNTGFPSIDKPWLKYCTSEQLQTKMPKCNCYEYLFERNKDHLDEVAISFLDREITFGEMFEMIETTARAFQAIGVDKGDIVVVVSVTIPELIYSFYALNRLGAVSNMVDPRTSVSGIRDYIQEVDAKYIVAMDVVCGKIEESIMGTSVESMVVISAIDMIYSSEQINQNIDKELSVYSWKEFLSIADCKNPKDCIFSENQCAAIVHTGGTTGTPKGVMLSNEYFNEMVFSFATNGLSFNRGSVLLSIMPPFIAYGIVNGVHVVLSSGMKIVLVPRFDPKELDELIIKYRPTHMLATPTHYEVLLKSKKMNGVDLSFVKMVGIGGDGLSEENEKRLNDFFEIHNCHSGVIKGYGMTEVSAAACANRPEQNVYGSVGLPFIKVVIAAFEPGTDHELKYGVQGELCILSPSTMLGYYNNQDETNKIKRKHSDGNEWIHSGDIGYVDEDGNVFIVGRIKRMIIRYDGFKVFPSMIENAVRKCVAVENCCAVAVDDKGHSQGQLPVVFVSLKEGMDWNQDETLWEIRNICEKILPEYAQPVMYRNISELPLTPIGKVNYRQLEEMATEL